MESIRIVPRKEIFAQRAAEKVHQNTENGKARKVKPLPGETHFLDENVPLPLIFGIIIRPHIVAFSQNEPSQQKGPIRQRPTATDIFANQPVTEQSVTGRRQE